MKKKLLCILGLFTLLFSLSSCTPQEVAVIVGNGYVGYLIDKLEESKHKETTSEKDNLDKKYLQPQYFEILPESLTVGTTIVPNKDIKVNVWNYGDKTSLNHFELYVTYEVDYRYETGYNGQWYDLDKPLTILEGFYSITLFVQYREGTIQLPIKIIK